LDKNIFELQEELGSEKRDQRLELGCPNFNIYKLEKIGEKEDLTQHILNHEVKVLITASIESIQIIELYIYTSSSKLAKAKKLTIGDQYLVIHYKLQNLESSPSWVTPQIQSHAFFLLHCHPNDLPSYFLGVFALEKGICIVCWSGSYKSKE
jgi:hypothetical protein